MEPSTAEALDKLEVEALVILLFLLVANLALS